MSTDLRHLRHALALVEYGSFARAAQALHLSQPALSRSIQSLERGVGSTLFLRSNDGVSPTEIGRLLLERARVVVRLADELEKDLSDHRELQSGQVAAGSGALPAELVMSTAVARFASAHPRVGIRLRIGDWDTLLRELRSRELDFFVAETSTLEGEPDIDIEPMHEHPLFFVARASHPLAGLGAQELERLFDWPIVAATRVPPRLLAPMLEARRRASGSAASGRAFPSIECGSLTISKRIVAQSDAVSPLPLAAVGEELEDGRFALLGTRPWLTLRYGIVSLRNGTSARATHALRQMVLDTELAHIREEQRALERWAHGGQALRDTMHHSSKDSTS